MVVIVAKGESHVNSTLLERYAPYNPLYIHYSYNYNDNNYNNIVSHSTNYTFYRVTYKI